MCSEAAEEGCTSKSLEVAAAQLALKTIPIILRTCSMPGSTYYYANIFGSGQHVHTSCNRNTRLSHLLSIGEASLMLMYTL